MKNKGFTLIELLAVIVILAIIALIAVPIILNIIDDSKKEAAKVSAQNYFDAVELALSKEYMKEPNVDLDGMYEIIENGEKIISATKEIEIQYSGQGLESGAVLVINSGKVTALQNAKIDKWDIFIEDGKIKLKELKSNNISQSTNMVTGQNFSTKIKTLANQKDMYCFWEDEKVTSISFLSNGSLPDGHTKETLQALRSVDVSLKENGEVIAYYDSGKVYVYSEKIISFNEDSNYMFTAFFALKQIQFGDINTSNVTNISGMFNGCNNLTSLDLSGLNTKNVTDMAYMFNGCSKLIELDLSKLDTSNVTNMSEMFRGCSNLTSLDLNGLNTSNVTNMYNMFFECDSINSAEYFLKLDTSSVTNMSEMFSNYSSSSPLDLSKLETNNAENMSSMFSNYSSPASLDLSKLDTSNVTNMGSMFNGYSSSSPLDLSELDTSNVIYMGGMFGGYNSSAPLNLSGLDTNKVTDMSSMFDNYNGLSTLDLSSFNTKNVTEMSYMFGWIASPVTVIVNKNTWKTDNANIEGMFEGSQAQITYVE